MGGFLGNVALADSEAIAEPDATVLVRKALNQWRGLNSYSEVTMTIHRPDWERRMSMKGWTRGEQDALIRFTAPTKDAGNATLKLGSKMWLFAPKLNQVIQLPASMMTQSWMGSDFSYNDLAKSDQVISDFTLTVLGRSEENDHTLYTIEAIPKPDAPVVWGKEVLVIRDDFILMSEQFYDQAMQRVKEMVTLKIAPLGGRTYPVLMRMKNLEELDHWTEVATDSAQFNLSIPDYIFTQANLRHPRPWSGAGSEQR
ncbi:MAG: outer membrane lipoprotein-sorting protein [Gammaproteobacteria bacterium]